MTSRILWAEQGPMSLTILPSARKRTRSAIAAERAGDRDALLLAARQLGRPVREPLGEPDLRAQLFDPAVLRGRAGQVERQNDVLPRRQHRQQVEELEDEADVLPAQPRQLRVIQLRDLGAGDRDFALRRLVETGQNVHQGRLARARRAHHGGQLPPRDLERDAAERVDCGVALAVAACDVGRGHDRGRPSAILRFLLNDDGLHGCSFLLGACAQVAATGAARSLRLALRSVEYAQIALTGPQTRATTPLTMRM